MKFRFRLKIRAGNVAEEKIFLLYDDLVKTIAPYTCDLLMSFVTYIKYTMQISIVLNGIFYLQML